MTVVRAFVMRCIKQWIWINGLFSDAFEFLRNTIEICKSLKVVAHLVYMNHQSKPKLMAFSKNQDPGIRKYFFSTNNNMLQIAVTKKDRKKQGSLPCVLVKWHYECAHMCTPVCRHTHTYLLYDNVNKWKHFPRCWPSDYWINAGNSPVNFPHKGQ